MSVQDNCEELTFCIMKKIVEEYNKIKDQIKDEEDYQDFIRDFLKKINTECLFAYLDEYIEGSPVTGYTCLLVNKCCKNEEGAYYGVPILKEDKQVENYWKDKEGKYFDEEYLNKRAFSSYLKVIGYKW